MFFNCSSYNTRNPLNNPPNNSAFVTLISLDSSSLVATSNFEEVNAACTNKRGSKGVEFDALSVLTEVSRILLLDGILVLVVTVIVTVGRGDVSTESASNSTPLDPHLFVQAALTSSKLLVATSEDESRDINVTKAELFGGLLRGFLVLYDEQLKNIPQGPSTKRDQIENDALRMETLLVSYFSEIVEKLSVDYLKDWAEAVFHIFTCGYK